jgi:hypothetical protein
VDVGVTSYSGFAAVVGADQFTCILATGIRFNVTTSTIPIIGAFFADVDTRVGPVVTYGRDFIQGRPAFAVTWAHVGCFNQHTDKANGFQLVLIDRGDVAAGAFDIEFNCSRVRWETSDASGGSGGLGGTSARVGYANGSGEPARSWPSLRGHGPTAERPTWPSRCSPRMWRWVYLRCRGGAKRRLPVLSRKRQSSWSGYATPSHFWEALAPPRITSENNDASACSTLAFLLMPGRRPPIGTAFAPGSKRRSAAAEDG